MDNTQVNQPPAAPAPNSAVTPPNPANFNSSPQVVQSSGMMKKVIIGLVVILILAAAGGGAFYYMTLNSNQTDNRAPVATYTPAPAATTQPDSLEQQANQVDEQPVESDLKPVDQDINNLKATSSATPVSK